MLSCGSPLMSWIEYCRKKFVANCYGNFGKKEKRKELNELSEMYRKNSKYSKNNKFKPSYGSAFLRPLLNKSNIIPRNT